MEIRCPLCGKISHVDMVIEIGQHVACPWCGDKFEYRGKERLAAFGIPKESIDCIKTHKFWFIIPAAILAIYCLFANPFGLPHLALQFALLLAVFVLLLPLWLFLWRIHRQAVEAICDCLTVLGENKFSRLAKFWIFIFTTSACVASIGVSLLVEMVIVVIYARTYYTRPSSGKDASLSGDGQRQQNV